MPTSRDWLELYRWPNDWTIVRPLTRADLTVGSLVAWSASSLDADQSKSWWDSQWKQLQANVFWIFILLDADGGRLDTLSFENWEDTGGLPVENMDQIFQLRRKGSLDYTIKKLRAFYLDMLVPLKRVLAGALPARFYTHYGFPISVGGLADYLRSPQFREIQKQSESGEGYPLEFDDRISLPMRIHDEITLVFDLFQVPETWSFERTEFYERAGWKWIVVSGDTYVIGVGHTPLEALSDVQYFVWPDDLANNDKRLNLASWLAKWTEPGTTAFDVALYTMLNLPTPAALPHGEFVEWAKGRGDK